jgi:hypothetical protein
MNPTLAFAVECSLSGIGETIAQLYLARWPKRLALLVESNLAGSFSDRQGWQRSLLAH